MNKYIRIMRIDHWIKQLFIIPGIAIAILFVQQYNIIQYGTVQYIINFVAGFIATCLIASANYCINEYLDAEFDRFHPTKKNRSVVTEDVRGSVVWTLWAILSILGFVISTFVNKYFLSMSILLWFMGLLYNVKPIRTKDIPIIDVLSESLNNAIRFLMGWFIIFTNAIPPISIVLGYWMCGAFLMSTKRFSEYRMINNPELAGQYRKSFKFYTEKILLVQSIFYALCAVFFSGIFLIKYRIELIIFIPFFMGLFCYYFYLAYKEDSVAQKPEKLYREKKLMLYCLFLIALFVVLMFVNIDLLNIFENQSLIFMN